MLCSLSFPCRFTMELAFTPAWLEPTVVPKLTLSAPLEVLWHFSFLLTLRSQGEDSFWSGLQWMLLLDLYLPLRQVCAVINGILYRGWYVQTNISKIPNNQGQIHKWIRIIIVVSKPSLRMFRCSFNLINT